MLASQSRQCGRAGGRVYNSGGRRRMYICLRADSDSSSRDALRVGRGSTTMSSQDPGTPAPLEDITGQRVGCERCVRFEEPCSTFCDTVFLLDANARVTWANQPLHGVTMTRFIGQPVADAIHEDHRNRSLAIIERVLADGQGASLVFKDSYAGRYWLVYLHATSAGEASIMAQAKSLCFSLFSLSPAQRRVLSRFGRGRTVARISEELGTSESAIRAHRPSPETARRYIARRLGRVG